MTTIESTSFGTLLRHLRLAAGLTQEKLADRAGVSAKAVSDLERDPRRTPRLDTAVLLADALGLDAEGRARILAAVQSRGATTGEPVLRGLPRPPTPLFGRAGVAEAVAELLRRGAHDDGPRLLTLTGIGGVGKTRLAIAATELTADAFPDGVLFIDLAPLRDPALILPAIASRLGIDERDKGPLPERVVAALQPRRLLLVLDNVEHLLPARDAILALVEACPRVVVLATSRIPLRVRGEREYRVAPLALPAASATSEALLRSPAVALFVDRAQAAGADLALTETTAPVLTEICRRLDGLPLAIELAAAWARLLPPAALLARLDHRLPLLVNGPDDLPARQRTMRDAIAWSYDLLSPDEQRLFRRLAVCVGGCTPAAAMAIGGAGEDEPALLVELAALVDRGLLRPAAVDDLGDIEPRMTMLETLREFGLQLLEQAGEVKDARGAHAAHFLGLAETARGSGLASDHDNLRTALSWSLAQHDAATALRLAGALWPFWSAHGHLAEGRRWLGDALALATATSAPDEDAYANALIGAVHLAIAHGAYNEAEGWCERAIAHARARGMQRHLVAALNAGGVLARERGNYPAATRCHDEALVLAKAQGDHSGTAAALTGLGYAAIFSGDVARGTTLCEQSLTIYRTTADRRGLATALVGLAAAVSHAGAFAESERFASEALDLFRALGDSGQVAEALWVIGISALLQGEFVRAIPVHEEILALRRTRGDELGANEPLAALGLIALQRGHHEQARSLLEEAIAIVTRYDDPWSRAMTVTLLGHVELAAGDAARALVRFTEAAAIFDAIGNPLYMPWVLEGLAVVTAERGAWELTARLCGARDALHGSLELGMPPADPAAYARTVARCRGALGEDAFVATHEAGGRLAPEQALAEVERVAATTLPR